MSFLPGLIGDLGKAWDSTVGNAWRTITGQNSGQPPQDVENPLPPPVDLPDENKPPEEVDNVAPVEPEDWKKHSFFQLLHLLRLDCIAHAEKRANKAYKDTVAVHEKNKTLNKLTQAITHGSNTKGEFEIKDESVKQLIVEAKKIGLQADEKKTKYTKDERDTLVKNLESLSGNMDTDTKLRMNEATEALGMRNTFYQELKSIWDKIVETVRKLIQAIVGR